jgi:hypothetical protein
LTRTINPGHFFPTVGDATKAFQRETGAQWERAQRERGPQTDRPGAP